MPPAHRHAVGVIPKHTVEMRSAIKGSVLIHTAADIGGIVAKTLLAERFESR
jgi:hypothetical protein